MDPILQFIKDYSLISGAIATTSASIGWVFRNLFEIFIENKKYNRELKTYFWKEKINASKKASEFYLEYQNLLYLLQLQIENLKSNKIEHQEFVKNIQKEVEFYTNKLKGFPHFEHHHINIFYEFDEQKSMELTNENYKLIRDISEINPSDNNSVQITQETLNKLKKNYLKLFEIQKKYVKNVRNDISKFIE